VASPRRGVLPSPDVSKPRRLAALAVAGGIVASSWIALAPSPGEAATGACKKVGIIGGSLSVGAADFQPSALKTYGITSTRTDAKVGRRITAKKTGGITALKAMRAKGFAPDCWIISLGTNDFPVRDKASVYEGWIKQMMTAVGSNARVLWVNIYRSKYRTYDRGFNSALVRLQSRYPNLYVADWDKYIQQHKSWLTRDGIHVSRAGYKDRAKWIAAQLHEQIT